MATFSMTSSLSEDQKSDWVEWYRKTFSSELSLFEAENVVLDAFGSPRKANPQQSSPQTKVSTTVSTTVSEAEQLRRRLKAVDAIELLAQDVDRVVPIPRRLWEADAPECRSCKRDLGWTRGRRRHHCRYCGLTFCDDCAPGEVRRCNCCSLQKVRFEAIKALRNIEREVLEACTVDGVASVARGYRNAIQLFSEEKGFVHPLLDEESTKKFLQRAKSILMEGMQSFLDMAETKACFKGASSPTSTPDSSILVKVL